MPRGHTTHGLTDHVPERFLGDLSLTTTLTTTPRHNLRKRETLCEGFAKKDTS
jgi:hypothetical protein